MSDRVGAVNIFHEKFIILNDTDRKNFSRITNKLLNDTFIVKEKYEDRNDYFFLCENKQMFETFFTLMDFEFVLDKQYALGYIKTTMNRNRERLNKFETALILILRKIYNKKKKEVTSTDKIFIIVDDLISEMDIAQIIPDSKKISYYDASLKKLRSHKIIDFTASKLNELTQIHLLPSICMIIPQNEIDCINIKLKALKREKEGGDNDENADQD